MITTTKIALISALAVIIHITLSRFAPKLGLIKLNYAKKPIPASYGVYVTCYALAGCVAAALLWGSSTVRLYVPVIFAMSLLGFADDVFGSRDVGGFAGHFKRLIFERKVTTGAVKAIGGGLVSLLAGFTAANWRAPEGLFNGAIIALSANTLNLLDLRPGRAFGAFIFGLAFAFAASGLTFTDPWPVVAVLVPASVFYMWDRSGRAMMGDSGSNLLGGVLGLAIVLETPLYAKIVWLTLILALHVYSEKRSITQTIERNPALRWIDRRLGVR